MGREIYVAYGFQTGHHCVKVNVENKIKVLCQLLSTKWSYMCAMGFEKLWLCSNLIKVAYFKHLNMMIFCTFRFEKSLLELL